MKKQCLIVFLFVILIFQKLHTQNTVGLLSYDVSNSFDGFNLFFPHNQPNVYLLNNCGEIINTWEDEDGFRPGNTVYLTEEGNLIKCKRDADVTDNFLWAGGGGGYVEILDWDNNLLWSYELNDSTMRLHHDIAPLKNGNIIMLAWEKKTRTEAINAGRDSNNIFEDELWPEFIFEINPNTDEIIWEWHVWDHLIQDFDPEKENFGPVEDHPELIDINWDTSDGDADWMHANAIDYHEERGQILLSIPTFNEIWIIDHTTSIAEASGHSGGLSMKGGDLLYRWGNPATYRAGTESDQKLFFQHDATFINKFLAPDHQYYNKISLFNNRAGVDFSTVNVFDPGFNVEKFEYPLQSGKYLPDDFEFTYTHPNPPQMHSTGLSSVQHLANGNILICVGRFGYSFETSINGDIYWEYVTPLAGGQPASQGDSLSLNSNLTFRMNRYPSDYTAFEGKNMSPKGFIELNPDITYCDRLTPLLEMQEENNIRFYPNPALNNITVERETNHNLEISIYNRFGALVKLLKISEEISHLDISDLKSGFYFLFLGTNKIQKLIIID